MARLLLGLGVAALLLGAVELGLRLLLGPPVPTMEVHLLPDEHARYIRMGEGRVKTVYQRSAERLTFPVVSEQPRFAVLGGSSVHEGEHGVGLALEFTQRAADLLGVPGYNLGFPGLDSFDLVRLVEELGATSLDALVVYAGHNDLGNVAMGRRYQGLLPAASLHLQVMFERTRLYWLLSGGLAAHGPQRARRGPPQPLSQLQRTTAVRHYRANIERLAWLCGRHDRPLVLVVPVSRITREPEPQPCEAPSCPDAAFAAGMALRHEDPAGAAALLRQARDLDGLAVRASSDLQDTVRAVAAAHDGVLLLDAPARLPMEDGLAVPADRLFTDPLHLSEEGHGALGEQLAEVLRPLLVPEP
jgi:lysophospholipase L1-like esterase